MAVVDRRNSPNTPPRTRSPPLIDWTIKRSRPVAVVGRARSRPCPEFPKFFALCQIGFRGFLGGAAVDAVDSVDAYEAVDAVDVVDAAEWRVVVW